MSEESRVYGCIIGPPGSTANWYAPYRLNRVAIETLPVEDEFPPLIRGMFTVPMDFGQDRSGFFREQVIHFGASFNHLSDIWNVWLAKFEGLLQRLYWFEAHLHLQMELHGSYHYQWDAKSGTDGSPWLRSPPETTMNWEFHGGPRNFRAA